MPMKIMAFRFFHPDSSEYLWLTVGDGFEPSLS